MNNLYNSSLQHQNAALLQISGSKARYRERTFRQWQLREGDVLYRSSVQQLSNTHLLAHLLRNQGLAERLMTSFGELHQIAEASVAELKQIYGVGTATAERIQAAFELSRRLTDSASEQRPCIGSPEDAYMLVRAGYQGQKQEILKVILLNTKNRVLKVETISIGTLNSSVMHPREVYRVALRHNAASIILTHNHPSGSPEPSLDDIQATEEIVEASKLIGIQLLDHVIIGNGKYISLKEKSSIPFEQVSKKKFNIKPRDAMLYALRKSKMFS